MGNKKILVVDDEKDLARTVSFRLKSKGYQVALAYDGKEALEKIEKEMPDLVMLDLMLPEIDGYEVCRRLKADNRYSKMPVIIFTALAQESDKKMGMAAGADAYITKPFDPMTLLAKIKELLKE